MGEKSNSVRRRDFLALAATSSVGLSSGCLDLIRGSSPSHPQLGWVAVENYHPDQQRLEIEIEREDTVVHESRHELAGKPESRIPGAVLECTWGDEPGPYTLRGRIADGDWVERVVDHTIDEETPKCVIAEGAYARYGSTEFGWLIQDWCEEVPSYQGGCSFANSNS
jgi:hypothetical protein